jgi:uncharacterized protein (DUF1015 family)
MAEVRAFRAIRFDLGRVGALSDVIAPPYDVIDQHLQDTLYQQNPFNIIRLILNKEEPTDNATENRYSRAARCLKEWCSSGVLSQDTARGLYVYHQDFDAEGRKYTRKGFLCRIRLEPFGQGKVFAHEETLPGPKADRLKLFRATAMNLSPIFGLFPDESGAVQAHLEEAIKRMLPLEATDHLGVVSRLWPVTDQHVISLVTGLMGPKSVFIADGHHRYETSLAYLYERRQTGAVLNDAAAPNFTLMMLVSMSDPGLVILPTHRLVSGISPLTAAQLQSTLAKHFQLETIGSGQKGARDTWELMLADGSQDLLGFGTSSDGNWLLARLRDRSPMDRLAIEYTKEWRGLAVSLLHVLVLDQLIPSSAEGKPCCQYVHLLKEVTGAVDSKECDLGVLVPPVTMNHVAQIAGNLEKMPPKSTYFYPKLLSGLVLNPLTGNY